MSTHIALIGKSMEPILKGVQLYGSIKKLFILHAPNNEQFRFKDVAEEVRKRLKNVGFSEVELRQIDSFNMQNIIDSIIGIVDNNTPPFYINITGGTNLMAGAACSAAFFVGARAYYVLGRSGSDSATLIELPVPNIPYYRTRQKTQLRVLESIKKVGGSATNRAIRQHLHITPQILSYHIQQLEKKALVATARATGSGAKRPDRRAINVSITGAGKLVLSWMGS